MSARRALRGLASGNHPLLGKISSWGVNRIPTTAPTTIWPRLLPPTQNVKVFVQLRGFTMGTKFIGGPHIQQCRWKVGLLVRNCSGNAYGGSSGTAAQSPSHTHSSSSLAGERPDHDQGGGGGGTGVEVIYFRGLPQFTIPLPSRRERCRFIVKPLTNSVGDLLNMIKHEDRGVDRISFLSTDGIRIASANTIEMLMEHDFDMVINDDVYHVVTPPQEKPTQEDLTRLSSVRNLVGQLYGALNVDEHQLRTEREMTMELERLKGLLFPLEEKREQLNELSLKRTNTMTWVGLGLMSVQFGILARLTWWEYSWDIMEPVTYFVTYGTAILCYAYFVLTKQEYVLPQVTDRQYLISFHKGAKKVGLDVNKYNQLRDKIHKIETDLNRLRDPLALHLPLRTRLSSDQDGDFLIRDPPTANSIVSKATAKLSQMFSKKGSSSSSSS
ncbi:calcium uniporter protein, mitochondrial [Folsomia candida]|uniref:calcium uniporter protein, mitochondrial n=1 Tax=Folsomia candida TaxID=158441 RepID=UPI000B8F687E|nr:calcium uniporter protein, mitochondrial [Folsomia candida]XP_021947419.1 calcium uniporter protein, mitochondrial [Folsomia candida]XP_035703440.1 calcium uniporter protein, mitochondrial [Folsomia candida]